MLGCLLALAACAGLLNAVTTREGISTKSGLRYSAGERGTYDLYIPDDAGPATPIVVFFYGGSWDRGAKEDYLFVGQSLAAAGIIAAIPDYRLYPEVTFPGFVIDGAEATAAILQASLAGHFGIPAGNRPIFLMGHSAGAHIAALLNYDQRYLRGAGVPEAAIAGFIGLAGPYDFLPLKSERYRRIFPQSTRGASQPVTFVDRSDPPALLITGGDDAIVEPRNSLALADKALQEGGQVEVMVFPEIGHVEAVLALSTAIPLNRRIRDAVVTFVRSRS